MSAAARATPVAPSTDSPTSAALMPGASFTPSPMKPTTSPLACRAWTMRAFCSGARRAKTSVCRTLTFRASGDSRATPRPLIADCARRFTRPASRLTTRGSSPERITTRTPCAASRATAAAAVALGGSAKVQRPSNTRPFSSSRVGSRGWPVQGREAMAMARRPWLARSLISAWAVLRSAGEKAFVDLPARRLAHSGSTASGAPFTNSRRPSGPSASPAPIRRT